MDLNLFRELVYRCGVSGYSSEVSSLFIREAKKLNLIHGKDILGSVSAVIPSTDKTDSKKPRVMITAHLDHVGYIVADNKLKDNKIKLYPIGAPFLEKNHAGIIKTEKGKIDTTIIVKDIETNDIYAEILDEEDLKDIQIGDVVYYAPNMDLTIKGKITAPFMDNKVSIFVLMQTMEKIMKKNKNKATLYFVLPSMEEVGGYGAAAVTDKIKPHISINVDTFPVDYKRDLNTGPIILRGPIYSSILGNNIEAQAKTYKIPHKRGVCSPEDESDSNIIVGRNGGILCSEIGIPCMNVHFPNETVSLKSIRGTIDLLTHVCQNIDLKELNNGM